MGNLKKITTIHYDIKIFYYTISLCIKLSKTKLILLMTESSFYFLNQHFQTVEMEEIIIVTFC